MVKRDQQVVLFPDQCVVILSKTMYYDMIVGTKADLYIVLSASMQLKIMLCQMTKLLRGQQGSPYELLSPNFQIVEAHLSFTLANSQQRQSHVGNMTTSRLGVKHWWPPPWPNEG